MYLFFLGNAIGETLYAENMKNHYVQTNCFSGDKRQLQRRSCSLLSNAPGFDTSFNPLSTSRAATANPRERRVPAAPCQLLPGAARKFSPHAPCHVDAQRCRTKIQPLMKFWNSISLKAVYFTNSQTFLPAFSERVLNPSHRKYPNCSHIKGVGEHPPCTDDLVLLPNPQHQRWILPPRPDPHRHIHKRLGLLRE